MTRPLPSQSELQHLFHYDMVTGALIWRHPRQAHLIGTVAGSYSTTGRRCPYVDIKYNGVVYKGHRLVWKYVYGDEPDAIDHINGNHQDNRLENLRVHPTHNQHNRVETRHLPEPLRIKGRWTETGKRVLKEYKRTGIWNELCR